ncbi:MAG: phosphate/phosphite/phosphonate ABC transporter substrate-binding protein [Campylobacterota bacterium]|nr:phosphate/phosphite/phosphonate ABC transporter substrate-binding protein [Campylobacterota bacterium]
MNKYIILLSLSSLLVADTLSFGVISPIDVNIMQKKISPLIKYLEKETGHKINFHSGRDYEDTIEKFSDSTYHLGYIGPAPYILATNKNKNLNILAGISSSKQGTSQSEIIVKKGSSLKSLDQLEGKVMAYGSPYSTLSYFLPKYMLSQKKIDTKLKNEHFLGGHDRVAEYIIMGRYDAGAVKSSVASAYSKYIDVIASSEQIHDFSVVANKELDQKIQDDIQKALYRLKDKSVLQSINKSATGFTQRVDSDYDNLRVIMEKVNQYTK